MMNKFVTFLIILLYVFLSYTGMVFAADISIVGQDTVNIGDTFEIDINTNTDGVLVNSINVVMDYNQDLLSFVGYKGDGAVIKLWVDIPYEKDGKIYFSGIAPGGVLGLYDPSKENLGDIPLVRLLFVAKRPGSAGFSFDKTELLKHDGKGTQLIHEQKNKEISIKNVSGQDVNNQDKIFDKTPPLPFEVSFVKSELSSETPSMIIFDAKDALSGIKEYKVKNGMGNWQDAKSPYQVSKGIFPHTVLVRAYDFYGNFQDSSIEIPGLISFKLLFIIILLIISGIFGFRVLKYRL